MRWIMTLFAALVAVGCATSPPHEVVQSSGKPTQATFRLDTTAVGVVPLEVRIDPGIDEPFQIPARVTYVTVEPERWTAGLTAVLGAITNGSTGGTPIDALLLGPAITEQLQMIDFFERFESAPVESIVEINGQSTIVRMTVFNTDNLAEGFLASFNAIRNEIVEDGVMTVRRPTAAEIDWYWTIIPWDIHEPVFVLENTEHTFFIDYGILDSGMLYIDDMHNLDWAP